MSTIICIFAFILFFTGDLNDLYGINKLMRFSFPLGVFILASVTVWSAVVGSPPVISPVFRICMGIYSLVFFVLTMYALFGAIAVNPSYIEQGSMRPVCTTGVYALCRHPGVLFFAALYIGLIFSAGLPPGIAVLCIVLNILLAAVEDIYIFPRVMDGYDSYKLSTPFLIPDTNSVRRCMSTLKEGTR